VRIMARLRLPVKPAAPPPQAIPGPEAPLGRHWG